MSLNFNKLKFFIPALFLTLISLTSCSKKAAPRLNDGTFSGFAEGRNGTIEIQITVEGGKITDAVLRNEKETPEIGRPAEEAMLEAIKKSNGRRDTIDVISGATITSNAMLDAFDSAIQLATGKNIAESSYSDTECDIVIIGAGGAGLVAATEAANRGARVIVLEKMGIVGGNTNNSTGGINASYTREQKRLGIVDSPEVFYEDTMKGGKNLNDPNLVHKLVDKSAETVEWLQSDLIGADLSDVGMFGGATNKRIHRPKGGAAIGSHLVPLLYKSARTQGADIRLKSKVIDIIPDESGEKPAGVIVEYDKGTYTISSSAVIITTGGFGANPQMIEKYNPSLKGFSTTNHKGATGDAFKMVEKFNAALTQMEQIQTHPTVVPGSGIMITEAVRGNGAILVNREGKRFVNEMETRDVVSAAILNQTKKTAFLVFDQNVRQSLSAIETYAKQGVLTTADTPERLAKKLGLATNSFSNTLAGYNKFVLDKTDHDFDRNPQSMERRLNKAPYYAIEIEPAIHHTMGGLKINEMAEVINKNGQVIPALFAAGEVTGGVHGGNRLGGNAVADICIFGKIAADSALEYIGK